MSEYYSPSDYRLNTWQFDSQEDEEDDETNNYTKEELDKAYNTYTRVYIWDLDEPLSREEFEKALEDSEDFTKVWGPRG